MQTVGDADKASPLQLAISSWKQSTSSSTQSAEHVDPSTRADSTVKEPSTVDNASQALQNLDEPIVAFLPQASTSHLRSDPRQKRSSEKESKRSTTATNRSEKHESRSTSVNNSRREKATPQMVEEGMLVDNQSQPRIHGHRRERGKDGRNKPPLKPDKHVNWGTTESRTEDDEIYVYNILDNSVRPYKPEEDLGRSISARHSPQVPNDVDNSKRQAELAEWLRRKKEMKNSIRKGTGSNRCPLE